MKRILAILFVGILVSGCTYRDNPISRNEVAVIMSGYGVALSAAVAYRNLPLCVKGGTKVCARRSVVVKLQEADKKVQIALIETSNFVKNYPQLSPAAYIEAAKSSIRVFQKVLVDNGIAK
jgi:hypothetical protein